MKLLITGASGFLGSRVVEAALSAGHEVRAIVRPSWNRSDLAWSDRVELHRTDLRAPVDLPAAFAGIDALLHLAAGVTGSDEERFAATVVTTERLLSAMADSATRRLVLVSSFSVYDYDAVGRRLDENSPVITASGNLYDRDGYAIAKSWQERITRERAAREGWELCVVRPGFIWGPGNEDLAGIGFQLGKLYLRVTGGNRLPLTYVDNAAEAIVRAAECPAAVGQTFNLTDSQGESPRRYQREWSRWRGERCWCLPLPYALGMLNARMARLVSRLLFGSNGKLPGILVPCRFAARFKPLRYSNQKIRQVLAWEPRVSFDQALITTFGGPGHLPDRPAATDHDSAQRGDLSSTSNEPSSGLGTEVHE